MTSVTVSDLFRYFIDRMCLKIARLVAGLGNPQDRFHDSTRIEKKHADFRNI